MRKSELYKFVADRSLSAEGDTLKALELHFLDGLPVADAAKQAGIHRNTAGLAIRRVGNRAKQAGFKRKLVKKVVWYK